MKIQEVKKTKRKSVLINARISEEEKKFIDDNELSVTKIIKEAIKELIFQEGSDDE